MIVKCSLANNVKKFRNRRNLTQEKLAEITGIAYKYIQKIEGKSTPNVGIELLEKLAKALKTTPSKLIETK